MERCYADMPLFDSSLHTIAHKFYLWILYRCPEYIASFLDAYKQCILWYVYFENRLLFIVIISRCDAVVQ